MTTTTQISARISKEPRDEARLVLTRESMERVAEQIERDEEPTEALKSLFRD